MKKGINENVNRLKYLMGILKEQTEDPEIPVGDKEKPSAIYTKIPVNWQNGKNSFELQSDENYTFDGEYKYYLLPTIVYYGSMGQLDPKSNPDVFNYGILEGTYSLIKTKDNNEIFEELCRKLLAFSFFSQICFATLQYSQTVLHLSIHQ